MRKTTIAATATALGLCVLARPTDAFALGPIGIEIAAKGGYATNPASGDPNPLGVGVGGRAGVTFLNVYAGLNAVYYLGGSKDLGPPLPKISSHSLLYGVEAGYGFTLVDILTIRPQLGVGNATFSSSAGPCCADVNNLYLEPGVTAIVGLGMWFVGADANLLVLPGIANGSGGSTTDTAFTAHAQLGVKF